MKRLIFTFLVLIWGTSAADSTSSFFSGTWCVSEQGIELTFIPGQKVAISATNQGEAVEGSGSYTFSDTSFTATISANDITVITSYFYRVVSDSVVEAKITAMNIDGEAVAYPPEWVNITRCITDK